MSKRGLWLSIAAIFVVACLVVLGSRQREAGPHLEPPAAARDTRETAVDSSTGREDPKQVANSPAPLADTTAPPEPAIAQSNDKTFRVNASERLVLDEQTRLNMEALFARTDRDRPTEAKQQALEPLPAGAAAQAGQLLEQYDNYQQAQRQTYPPGVAPTTEEAALAELDGLHALRVAHFGPIVARALYGEEEALSRQLVELMRLEKDQSLTLEEKAVRAQQLQDSRTRVDPH